MFSFIDGRFPSGELFKLTGLTAYKELNKRAFTELDESLQNRIQDYNLRTVTLLKQSDPDLKFEIFERLNTGSEPLVGLRYFGPEACPDAPNLGDYRKRCKKYKAGLRKRTHQNKTDQGFRELKDALWIGSPFEDQG